MPAKAEIEAVLTREGWTLIPFGRSPRPRDPDLSLIVRPGGITAGRTAVEVWIINAAAASLYDPDAGLDEVADRLYELLRRHLSDVSVTPGPTYDPTGGAPHMTMILVGFLGSAGLSA